MTFTENANKIFNQAIADYHIKDNIDTPINNPFAEGTIENRLYLKCWIDTVQWHFEDIIRDPQIDPAEALVLKRRIDKSNQDRTDLVEQIDSYFREIYKDVKVQSDARINTESPAWAVDRLSILALKIYHMKEQVERYPDNLRFADVSRSGQQSMMDLQLFAEGKAAPALSSEQTRQAVAAGTLKAH